MLENLYDEQIQVGLDPRSVQTKFLEGRRSHDHALQEGQLECSVLTNKYFER